MKIICRETYTLIPEGVDAAAEKLMLVLQAHTELKKKDALLTRLSMEEILLNWMQTDAGETVLLYIEQQGKKLNISLELQSPYLNIVKNPLKNTEEYGGYGLTGTIMANLGMTWMHQMAEGINKVFIRVPAKKTNQLVQVGVAIFLAVAVGITLNILPQYIGKVCSDYIINPLFNTFMGFLSAIVGPMMFLSVVCGVVNIGSSRQLGYIGKKVCSRYIMGITEAALLGVFLTILFFQVGLKGSGSGDGQLMALLDLLYDIVPDNLVNPFITGNTLQIIFLALLIGTTITVIRNQVPLAVGAIDQCNTIVQQILTGISRMVPVFVFLSIIRLVLTQDIGDLSGFAKMILVYLMGSLILIAYHLLRVWKNLKISPKLIIKKLMPTYLIALSTASSAAAFSECTSACTEKLGIKNTLVNFGIPMGIVVYMPNHALWLILFVGACAQYYGRVLTPTDMLISVFMAVFLAVAAPPIPGGALTCYTIMLMQMNIPLEMLAIASAINLVVDFTGTAGHLFANQVELLIVAEKLDMVDMEKLKKER